MEIQKKIAVLGSGASGMACAIHCARCFGKGSVILVEKQSRPGRKLLAAGNGRCNISNEDLSLSHYHGEAALYTSVLERFPLEKALDFFQSLGLVLRADEAGRLYPYSNRGSSVFGRLQAELERLQVELLLDHPVSAIQKQKNGFRLISETDTILAQYVVLCCGSKACPSLGADDSVLTLLKPFSIRYSPFFPSLSPIMTLEKHKMLKGVRAAGKVWVTADGKALPAKEGEIQFTETGLSGICVFEISRLVHEYLTFGTVRGKEIHSLRVTADVVPDMSFQQLNEYLKSCRKLFCYELADRLFSGLLPEKLSEYIAAGCKVQQRSCGELGDGTIKKMASQAKTMSFTPIPFEAFSQAQVCAGGLGSDEVDPRTLMLRKIPGLFACGELLNVDGDCGGYNLHFAFGSASIPVKFMK